MIVGSQAPGESAEGVEVEVKASVNSSVDGDYDVWASRVLVSTLAARWRASMRKGPNNVLNPQ